MDHLHEAAAADFVFHSHECHLGPPSASRFWPMHIPFFPDEWFVIKRTGSIASCVGPAVTSTRFPRVSFCKCDLPLNIFHAHFRLRHLCRIRIAACKSACCRRYHFTSILLQCAHNIAHNGILIHGAVFIAGATIFLRRRASAVVVNISSAIIPCASFPIIGCCGRDHHHIRLFCNGDMLHTVLKFLVQMCQSGIYFPLMFQNVIGLIKLTAFGVMIP